MSASRSGSTILKRVAFLNRSGSLAKPLRYSEVKDALELVSEEGALAMLQELEDQSLKVPDPAAFIKRKAAAAGSGGANAKRKADEISTAPSGSTKKGSDGIVAKRLRLLNVTGRLAQSVSCSIVQGALDSLDVAQAMVILTGLENAKVRDPTSYIRAAVRAAGGTIPAEMEDGPRPHEEEDEETAEEPPASRPPARRPIVKQELGRGGAWGVKVEHGKAGKGKGGKGRWVKTEDLSDEEKLSRRIGWINQNMDFATPIVESEVLQALDCVGLRQAMRILRRLEETAGEAADPNEQITDAVARAGWIWAKPDIIDDDEKVAKRVSWLNQFGGLTCPIDYAEVADMLDALQVPHAMVLLRELELQSNTVEDPTSYIKQQVASAGGDDVQLPEVDTAQEDSAIGQRIAALNESGTLAAPIEFGEVLSGLSRIGDKTALGLLQEIENKGTSLKDPTGFLKFKLKAKLASMGLTLEEAADPNTEILKRVEYLNDYGGIAQDINYNQVSASLEALGVDRALAVLKELEDKRETIRDPTAFVRQVASLSSRRPTAPATSGATKAGPPSAGGDVPTLSGLVSILNKKGRTPFKLADVASALDTLGPSAQTVLRDMVEKRLGLDDPATYINAAAFKASRANKRVGEEDDVQKLTRKMNWLNQFGGLTETIKLEEVVGALYCLGIPQSMAILKGLQERGSRVNDPTSYIKTAIQRANSIVTTKAEPEPEDEDMEDSQRAAEAAYYTSADAYNFEDPAEERAQALEGQEAAAEAGDLDLYDEDAGNAAEMEAAAAVVDAEMANWEDQNAVPTTRTKPLEVRAMISARNKRTSYYPATEPKEPEKKATSSVKRIVGAVTGYNKQVPREAKKTFKVAPRTLLETKQEDEMDEAPTPEPTSEAPVSSKRAALPITPQEKLVQVRNLALSQPALGRHFPEVVGETAFLQS